MGVPEREEMALTQEEEYQIQQQRVMNDDGLLKALQPINFENKIMGGQNFQNFIGNKLPQIHGALSFTQKINMLTGKGENKMESQINAQNKINQILSTSNGSKKVEDLLGTTNTKTKKFSVDEYFKPGKSSSNKISELLGNNNKQKSKFKFDDVMGFGKRAYTGINVQNKLNEEFGTGKNKKTNNKQSFSGMNIQNKLTEAFGMQKNKKSNMGMQPFAGINIQNKLNNAFGIGMNKKSNITNQKNNTIKKINNGFGINTSNFNIKKFIGNPEKTANTRMKQQNGLPMFGDFDGDKVLNMFDCNPLDPTKQATYHDMIGRLKSNVGTMKDNAVSGYNTVKNKLGLTGNKQNLSNDKISNGPTDIYSKGQYIDATKLNLLDNDSQNQRVIKPTTPDTMIAQRGEQGFGTTFGTTKLSGPGNNGNIGLDTNNDGIVNKLDNNVSNIVSNNRVSAVDKLNKQAQQLFILMENASTEKERKKYASMYTSVLQNIRTEGTLDLQNRKFDAERFDKKSEKIGKVTLGTQQYELQKDKFNFEKDLTQQKFDESKKDSRTKKVLTQDAFDYQKERDTMSDALKLKNADKSFALEKQKLAVLAGKNERAMWENKVKAGSNMIGSIVGSGNSLKGFENVVSGMNNSSSTGQGINMMTGRVGGNSQNMMMMAGGLTQSEPMSSKIMSTVGGQSQSKSFAQKVNESVTRKTPEEVMEEEKLQQYTPQQNEQVIQQPIQQQPQQYSQQRPVFYAQPQQMQGREPNWNNLSPQEAAQYDPEYARYMAESKEENVYRRGPYKKRRY